MTREGKLQLAVLFSANEQGDSQKTWLPCEVETSSIAMAVKYFRHHIVQSKEKAFVLTDSKACV